MSDEVWRALYGDPEGHWLILTGMVGSISPPYIDVGVDSRIVRLVNLGDPADVVRGVYGRLHAAFPGSRAGAGRAKGRPRATAGLQEVVAKKLDVSQQTVSRYVAGTSTPDLAPAGWSRLVQMHFADQLGLTQDQEQHREEDRRG